MTPSAMTVPSLVAMKRRREKITMVTAYDYHSARVCDAAGVEVLLVGDSLGMVVQGRANTLAVTVDDIVYHTTLVRRADPKALVVADMPFLSYQVSPPEAVANAGKLVKEGGAQAVKLEGGREFLHAVGALCDASIPVMGHLGLTPQSIHRFGGFKVQGRGGAARAALLEAAVAVEAAGAFALVLECIPSELAREVSERLEIPTVGIGAGPACDGQVLVFHDLLGIEERIAPRFVRRYAELGRATREAIAGFARDVRSGAFPAEAESFEDPGFRSQPSQPSASDGPEIKRLYGA